MDLRKLSLSAAALAVFLPGLSFADAEAHALKACVAALTSSLAPGATPAVKVNYRRQAGSPLSEYYAREFTFTLHASDARTSTRLATMSCSATERGTVLTLRSLAAAGDGTKVAAR